MRAWIFAVLFVLGFTPVFAAPTCVDRAGDTIRCATPGAMPVGWTPSPQVLWERQLSPHQGPTTDDIVKVLAGIALFLVLIALLPAFDGAKGWDRQEGDDEKND